jgi:pyroglutamyl-peptidase
VLHLHLGVGGTDYELERYSHNRTEFGKIPDNDKVLLKRGFILEGKPYQLASHVGISELKEELQDKMKGKLPPGVDLQISEDAGGFICNYIYYKSCLHLQEKELHHSLFLHIPHRAGREDKLAETDLKCIEALLGILLKKKNNLTTE